MRLTGVLFVLYTGFTIILILKLIRHVNCNGSIGYFNESAEARLPISTVWHITNRIGFSFRTCKYGELLSQTGANGDYFKLGLVNTSLEFQWKVEGDIGSLTIGSELSNNQWYTVDFYSYLGAIHLNISKGGTLRFSSLISDSIHRSFLQNVNLTSGSALTVGRSFIGCIAQGPFINLTQPELYSTGIIWNECRMPPKGGCSAADRDINDCWSSPCNNGGTCIDEFQNYTCRCLPAYNGSRCENDLSYLGCIIHPCQNNGSCEDVTQGQRNYKCTCTAGFNGINCENNLDECGVNPCLNNGKCIDGIDSYTCNCTGTGYHGLTCNEDVDECRNNPCGTGECFNNPGSYTCVCADGYTGYQCLQEINECDSSPCKNGGSCSDLIDDYHCDCVLGYTGKNCQDNIDDCLSPNATCPGLNSMCIDGVNTYTCGCKPGYSGTSPNCQDINECETSPCKNGSCLNKENAYECDCFPGFNGTNCDNNIDDCVGNPCQNNASCTDGIANYSCDCLTGFTGHDCQININDCKSDSCLNGGSCQDLVNDIECTCVAGWTGNHCEININECQLNPCQNGGSCTDLINAFNCTCLPGFTDSNCSTNINDCDPNPCNNSGQCIDGVNSFTCNCTSDWMGHTCDEVYDACSFQPCQNGGTCATEIPSHDYNCTCVLGFRGNNCEENINDCDGVVCENPYHQCFDGINNYTCGCPVGFTGDDCSTNINECLSNPCQNGGTCDDLTGKYSCTCNQEILYYPSTNVPYLAGYNGTDCENDINECLYDPPICQNGAECRNKPGDFLCICIRDDNYRYYTGRLCDISTTYCENTNELVKNDPPACHNGGTCIPNVDDFTCSCAPGFNGSRCKHNIDECLLEAEPCKYNGTCHDGINGYSCECIPGITGAKCEVNIDECAADPCWNESTCCWNGGQCLDGINDYSCNCTDTGFKGEHCEVNIDDCIPEPCVNGGTCVDGVKNYTCECFLGYSGYNCEVDINECNSNPCQYGGTCLEKSNRTLYEIGHPGYENFSYSQAAGYYCICVAGITGKNCETNLPDCLPDSCFNGATCVDGINSFTCNCTKGFRGDQCKTNIDECTEYGPPCKNGGVCTDLIANYECSCPEFYHGKQYGGKNCTVELLSCQTNNCQNGRCQPFLVNEQTNQQDYRCLCDAGFTGDLCNVSTTMSFLQSTSYLYHAPSQHQNGSLNMSFQFRTTLPKGLLCAVVKDTSSIFIEIHQSELYITLSNLGGANSTSTQRIPIIVTDAEWKQVDIVINDSISLKLQDSKCQENQCILQINLGQDFSQYEKIYFGNNFALDSTRSQQYFTGCMQDIIVDGVYKLPESAASILAGCPRTDQCNPDPCNSHGSCDDLWNKFQCNCRRPYLGTSCADEFTAATFSYENNPSSVTYILPNEQQETVKKKIVLSMFLRTRQADGLIMFLGSLQNSFLTLELLNGAFASRLHLCGLSKFIASSSKNNNGEQAFVELSLMDSHLSLKIDNIVAENISLNIATSCEFTASTIKFGGDTINSRKKREVVTGRSVADFSNTAPYKGTVQDARINEISLLFFDFDSNPSLSVANMTKSASTGVVANEVTDDLCTSLSPCQNNATCTNVFFNDYSCDCPLGYRGKNCSELNFCVLGKCPDGATCESINDGFECRSPTTFYSPNSVMVYRHNLSLDRTFDKISLQLRTRIFNGILLIVKNDLYPLEVALVDGIVNVHLQLNTSATEVSGQKQLNDGNWYTIEITQQTDGLQVNVLRENNTEYDTADKIISPSNLLTDLLHSDASIFVGGESNINTKSFYRHQFKGCMENIRIGGILLPPFFESDIINNTASETFSLTEKTDINLGCHGADACLHNRCHNSGQCTDIWNDYACSCLGGYSGRYCEVNNDECTKNDCQNGGRCLDGVNTYTCQCFPGSAGSRCETAVSECGSSPCQNNATCTDLVGDYNCTCPAEYTGKTCDTLVAQTCNGNLCKNGGTCSPLNISLKNVVTEVFQCTCVPGYYGPLCEDVTNYCEKLPCLNGGNCTSNVSIQNYTCACPTGFSGYNCDININDCDPNPCSHENQCIDGINDYFCNCSQGWTGKRCDEDIDECNTTQPCVKGTCQNTLGSYSCICEPGYTGPTCDEDINECNLTEVVCQNGASCDNTEGSYTCNCTLGYEGKNCSIPNCSHVQCNYTGNCTIDANKWKCDCPPYHEGKLCEHKGLCAYNPCQEQNTEICQQNITANTYQCTCIAGWKGVNCTEDVNECDTSPCQNGANCTNTDGSFECVCVPGYTGKYCGENINECLPDPCQQQAPCTDLIDDYFCNCSGTNYMGKDCDEDINECENSVCQHAGVCTNLPGDYRCNCTVGYGGKRCHIDDPCIKNKPCKNGATCTPMFHEKNESATQTCQCTDAYEGVFCEIVDPTKEKLEDDNVVYIVVGVVVAVLIVVFIIALYIGITQIRKKRATRGAYSPSRQEMSGSRIELGNNKLKIPPEERLI